MAGLFTQELTRRTQAAGASSAVTEAGAVIGAAIDAGLVSLTDVLHQVRSCSTRDELDAMLTALAVDLALAAGAMDGDL
jgi:hypothetical protein